MIHDHCRRSARGRKNIEKRSRGKPEDKCHKKRTRVANRSLLVLVLTNGFVNTPNLQWVRKNILSQLHMKYVIWWSGVRAIIIDL